MLDEKSTPKDGPLPNSPEFVKRVEEALKKFTTDLENANDGSALLEAAKEVGQADKKLCALALNRAKKLMLARRFLDDSFSKGGFGGMSQKDKMKFIEVLTKIKDPHIIAELKVGMLPSSGRRNDVLLDSTARAASAELMSDDSGNQLDAATSETIRISLPKNRKRPLLPPGILPVGSSNGSGLPEMNSDVILATSEALNTANIELLHQKTLTVKAQRLSEAMKDPSFLTLEEDVKEKIRSSYVSAVLGMETKDV